MKNTDLHTHCYYSDGHLSPKKLVRLAKKRGIKNLALTDHDTVRGVAEAVREGKKIGVNVIPGVEIRTNYSEILAYFIDTKNKNLKKELKKQNKKVQDRVKDICKKLMKRGYKISYKELQKKYPKAKENLNEFHPIYELYVKKYAKSTFESRDIIWGDKKNRPKKIKEISVVKAIKLVKNAGGVPVLAHPWLAEDKNLTKIKSLVKAGLKGIEISNGDNKKFMIKMSKNKNIVKRIRYLAKKYNLIITKGTDFHGSKLAKLMPGTHNLGKNNCDEKVVGELKDYSN